MDQIALHAHWPAANRKMVAKLISELAYEQAFTIEESNDEFSFIISQDVGYYFLGKPNIWGQIVIDPISLDRRSAGNSSEITATAFV